MKLLACEGQWLEQTWRRDQYKGCQRSWRLESRVLSAKMEVPDFEDMKEVSEVEYVERVEAAGSFEDEVDTKKASTTSRD